MVVVVPRTNDVVATIHEEVHVYVHVEDVVQHYYSWWVLLLAVEAVDIDDHDLHDWVVVVHSAVVDDMHEIVVVVVHTVREKVLFLLYLLLLLLLLLMMLVPLEDDCVESIH